MAQSKDTLQSDAKVVIIGAGFGGISAAGQLAAKNVNILIIDRNNFHTFTPLLYQVATCALDPSDIAYPVRGIYRKKRNVQFLLGEVISIDPNRRIVTVRNHDGAREETYDYLIVAAGSVTNFFGNQQLEQFAFGLKDLSDSVRLRNHILRLFEQAAWTEDIDVRQALTTMVVVGGGPTGLETAGALYELYNHVLANEYHQERIHARVILVEMLDHLLDPYTERLQEAARKQLESLGVEVILSNGVEDVQPDHIKLQDGMQIQTHTLIWSAGVRGAPLAKALQVELQNGDRIPISDTMEVVGYDHIFAVGDIAYLEYPETGQPYAQLIPVAQQQGRLAGKNILRHINGEAQQSFAYHDRGLMATIGRRRAVAWPFYKVQLTGFVAWITWLFLHLLWLMGFRNQLNVLVNWMWNYLTYDRSVRIILSREPSKATGSTMIREDDAQPAERETKAT